MTKYETEMLLVDSESQQDLESAIQKIAELGDGWINVEPIVEEEHQNEVPGFFAWFSARGPKVPVGPSYPEINRTWLLWVSPMDQGEELLTNFKKWESSPQKYGFHAKITQNMDWFGK